MDFQQLTTTSNPTNSSTTNTAFWNDLLGNQYGTVDGRIPSSSSSSSPPTIVSYDLNDHSSRIQHVVRSSQQKMMALSKIIWQHLKPGVVPPNSTNYHQLWRFRMFVLMVGCVAMFFWFWAIINTIRMKYGQDLGMYSFGLVIISSLLVLTKTAAPKQGMFDRRMCLFMTATHGLVTMNYILGVIFAVSIGTVIYWRFGTYCIIFAILWAMVTNHGWKVGSHIVDLLDSPAEEFEEERLSYY